MVKGEYKDIGVIEVGKLDLGKGGGIGVILRKDD